MASANDVKCPRCGAMVLYQKVFCDCGRSIGFPNVRRAEEMQTDLDRHYADALQDAAARGVQSGIRELERVLGGSVATINIDAKLLYNLAVGTNYISYYKALDEGLRQIAERQYHGQRQKVDAVIHTGYEAEILNAALSPDGRGLTNYGPIVLRLLEVSIDDRSSVLRENAFDFFERNNLGARNAEEANGWRAIWASRHRLGVAHLAPQVTSATAISDIPGLVLTSGSTRTDDRYMEVHIHGELSWQGIGSIVLERPLTDAAQQEDWEFARQKLTSRGISIS